MKKYTSILLGTGAFLGAAVSAHAAPLFSVGDNFDVFFDGTLKGAWNSNVTAMTGGPKKIDDYSIIMSPGVVANWGRNSKISANVFFREDMIRYLNHSSLNENLAKLYADAQYKGDPFSVRVDFSYLQMYQNTPSALGSAALSGEPAIIRYDKMNAGINGVYMLSPKTSLELGFNYSSTRYVEGWDHAYQDVYDYSVPVAIYYQYSPQLDIGLYGNYRFSNVQDLKNMNPYSQTDYGRNRSTYFGGVSARLKSWQRLSGFVNVGVTVVDIDSITYQHPLFGPQEYAGISRWNFGADMRLSYELTQKISLNMSAYQNYSVGAQGQNICNTGGGLNGRYQINQFFDASANFINYTHSKYDYGRADDTYSFGAGVGWTPNSHLRFSIGYTFFWNSSTNPGSCYQGHIISASGSLRY